MRIGNRYGPSYDHGAVRSAAALAIPDHALVIAYDSMPAATLYRLARNGWWLSTPGELATVPELALRGAQFIAARGERRADLPRSEPRCLKWMNWRSTGYRPDYFRRITSSTVPSWRNSTSGVTPWAMWICHHQRWATIQVPDGNAAT